jgi:hypothetical protein
MTAIQLKDGTYVEPDPEQVIKWSRLYPDIDVHQEINAMVGWCDANRTRRNTAKGLNRFINSWLQRANSNGGSPFAGQKKGIVKTRDISFQDSLNDRDWAK